MKPSELYPPLADDRLTVVADILRRCRNMAARDARRELGITGLSIGIAAYEMTKYALFKAMDLYPWLFIREVDHHLVIEIGGIPTRYFPAKPGDDIPQRTLEIGQEEQGQITMAFGNVGMHPDVRCLRFEVLKRPDYSTERVAFVFVDKEGERFHEWVVPETKTRRRKSSRQVAATSYNLDDSASEVRPEINA